MKLSYDKLLSRSAFKFNLRRYSQDVWRAYNYPWVAIVHWAWARHSAVELAGAGGRGAGAGAGAGARGAGAGAGRAEAGQARGGAGAAVKLAAEVDGSAAMMVTWRAMMRYGAPQCPLSEGREACDVGASAANGIIGRGLHSSAFQLNLSAIRNMGGAFRGYLEDD